MKRSVAVAVLCLLSTVAAGQSLGELAKKEKKRRETNQKKGVAVRTVNESEISSHAPEETSPASEAKQSGTELDVEGAIRKALAGKRGGTAGPGSDVAPPKPTPPPAIGPAPSFRLPDRTGRTHSLRNFRGRPLLIDFWATWCAPCRTTMPEVEKLYRKYRGRGLQVVGINIEGKSRDVLNFLDQSGYGFLVLFDSGNWESEVAQQYGVSSIPRTFLVDKHGSIVYSGHPGQLKESLIEATLE